MIIIIQLIIFWITIDTDSGILPESLVGKGIAIFFHDPHLCETVKNSFVC